MPLTAGSESTRTPAYAPVKERRGGGGQWRLKEGLPFPLPPTCSPDSLPSPPPPLLPSHLLPSSPPPRQLTLAGRLVGAVPLPSPPSSLPPPFSPPPSLICILALTGRLILDALPARPLPSSSQLPPHLQTCASSMPHWSGSSMPRLPGSGAWTRACPRSRLRHHGRRAA